MVSFNPRRRRLHSTAPPFFSSPPYRKEEYLAKRGEVVFSTASAGVPHALKKHPRLTLKAQVAASAAGAVVRHSGKKSSVPRTAGPVGWTGTDACIEQRPPDRNGRERQLRPIFYSPHLWAKLFVNPVIPSKNLRAPSCSSW